MKKPALLFAFLVSSLVSAQFTVAGSTSTDQVVGKFQNFVKLTKSDSKGKLVYNDFTMTPTINFDHYEFIFSIDGTTLSKIHQIITDHFESRVPETVTLNFPEGNMYLLFEKAIGFYTFKFQFDNKNPSKEKNNTPKRETYPMDRKEVDRLFGT